MTTWPTAQECSSIWKETGLSDEVAAHCEAVAALAVEVATLARERHHRVDVALVHAGALLHDVGRAKTQEIDHASVGAALLRERGLPEALVLVVERHTGGGIGPEEAESLGLPVKDYTPETLEEKLVAGCDNLVAGTKRQRIQAALDDLESKGLEEAARKVRRLHRQLSAYAGRDLDEFVEAE